MSKISLVIKIRPNDMPLWQDCQWRRNACGGDDCPICGRINRDRKRHIEFGEDPDSIDSVMADVSNSFKEMLSLLKIDMEKKGIDMDTVYEEEKNPMPIDFPIYNKIMQWRQGVYDIVEDSTEDSDAWLKTEAGENLMWYSSTLMVKIFRQLSTVWQMKRGKGEFLESEYRYTGFVLGEVIDILEKSLNELSTNGGVFAGQFNIARLSFDAIRQEILNYKI
ncbi:MAG: hypothetical protein Q7T50_06445 [Candidatus Magasanikbacteria bacterium]|nr:hypothetical protein [Candidatus Magasanikbacteria bacterium]